MILTSDKTKYIRYFTLYCIVLYIVLSVFFLQTGYVEGDDARTVLYHIMDRKKEIQVPYSSYHSGFDFILSFIKPDEPILRQSAVIVSFVCGGIALYLTGVILILASEQISHSHFTYLLLLPFMIPEYIFNSGYCNATNVGLVFALSAGISLIKYIADKNINFLLLYILLFAVSVPFRWSLVYFLPTFLGLFLYQTHLKPSYSMLLAFLLSSLLALVGAVSAIFLTGYSMQDMWATYFWAQNLIENTGHSIISQAVNAVSYYSIPFLICLISGILFSLRNTPNGKRILVLVLISILPYFTLMFQTNFKFSVTYMPALVLLGYIGYNSIQSNLKIRYFLFSLTILMWVCGIQVYASHVAYGPGFHNKKEAYINRYQPEHLQKRVNLQNVTLSLSGGLLMPTTEGPRPLWGYFHVIFGGEWRSYISLLESERETFINAGKNKSLMLFMDSKIATVQCDLYRLGYKTGPYEFDEKNRFHFRTYTQGADTIQLHIVPGIKNKSSWIIQFQKKIKKPVILYSKYSALISDIAARQTSSNILNAYTILIKGNSSK